MIADEAIDFVKTRLGEDVPMNNVNLDLKVGESQDTTFVGLGGVKANVTIIREL